MLFGYAEGKGQRISGVGLIKKTGGCPYILLINIADALGVSIDKLIGRGKI